MRAWTKTLLSLHLVMICLAISCSPAQTASDTAILDKKEHLSLSYVPAKATCLIAARPADLFSRTDFKSEYEHILNKEGHFSEIIEPTEVSKALLIWVSPSPDAIVFKIKPSTREAAIQIKAFLGAPVGKPTDFHSRFYVKSSHGWNILELEDECLLFSQHEHLIKECIKSGVKGATDCDWAKTWNEEANSDILFFANTNFLRLLGRGGQPFGRQLIEPDLMNTCRWLVGRIKFEKGMRFSVMEQAHSSGDANKLSEDNRSILEALRGLISQKKKSLLTNLHKRSHRRSQLLSESDAILSEAKITVQDNRVEISGGTTPEFSKRVPAEVAYAVRSAGVAVKIDRSSHNLKQLVLALHNYESTYKQFPAAIQIGPKNQTHSWRVSILPFLNGHEKLYEQYRMDEPWYSENNKQLLSQMPSIFGDSKAGETPYKVVTSDHASDRFHSIFRKGPSMGGPRLAEINVDGASRTICLIETQPMLPWTKPEDCEISFNPIRPGNEPELQLPKFGGLLPRGFMVGMADYRTTLFINSGANSDQLRALFSTNGGEVIPDFEPLNAPTEFQTQEFDNGVRIKLNGEPFAEYRTDGPNPILLLLSGPDGAIITPPSPQESNNKQQDHFPSNGICLTYPSINGFDFWSERGNRVKHHRFSRIEGGLHGVVDSVSHWVDGKGEMLIEEKRRMTFGDDSSGRWIDFFARLECKVDQLTFDPTDDAIFAIRVAEPMTVDAKLGGRISNSNGLNDVSALGKPADWIDYSGPIGDKTYGLTIFSDRLTRWDVSSNGSLGLYLNQPTGFKRNEFSQGFNMKKGQGLFFHFRFLLHAGPADTEILDRVFQSFCQSQFYEPNL